MPVPEVTPPPIPGTRATFRDIFKGSLRAIHCLESGEEPDGPQIQDGIVIANQMLDAWAAEGFMLFTSLISDFPLVANQADYTLGAAGDFNIARPPSLDAAAIVIMSNPAQPNEFPIPIYTTQDWREKLPIKNVPSNLPLGVYDDGGFPLRTLTLWPIPEDATNLFRLYSPLALSQFPDTNTFMAYPPGYLECLRYNLALRLAPDYGASVSPEVATLAISSLARVKSSNPDDTQLRSDLVSCYGSSNMRSELFNIP